LSSAAASMVAMIIVEVLLLLLQEGVKAGRMPLCGCWPKAHQD